MAARPESTPPDRPAVYAAALALLLLASLSTFLAANDYPLASVEIALLLAACLAAGTALGVVVRLGLRTPAALILGMCAAVCIEVLQDLEERKVALVVVPLACLGAAWLLRRHFAAVVAAASMVWLTTTLVIPATTPEGQAGEQGAALPSPATKHDALPVILHLVLDEHIGLDGVPPEIAGSDAFKRELADFYVSRGFRVDAGAFSQYLDTRNSLANLLNFTSADDGWAHLAKGRTRPYVLERSAYFEQLAARGYRLRVYESDYLDFCRVPGVAYASCLRYSGHKIGAVSRTSLDALERAQFIYNSFLSTSYYVIRAQAAYERIRRSFPQAPLPEWGQGTSRVGPVPVLPVLAQLEKDLRSATRGTAYFAHLLIPHYPYVLDESCALRDDIDEWLYNAPHVQPSELVRNTPQTREARYVRYLEQVRCQQRLLERLFRAMKDSGVWEDAVVVVHGDHGSRILRHLPVTANAAQLSHADLRDAFSTLFAIRAPGTEAGVREGLRPLQRLLGEAFRVPGSDYAPNVYLRSENGKAFKPYPLTSFH